MTNPLTELDESSFRSILDRLAPVLRSLGDELGIDLRIRRATYSRVQGEITVEAATISDKGVRMDKEAGEFLRHASRFGLNPSDLGREFECGGTRLRIVGMRPRAANPVICDETSTGKRFMVSTESIRMHVGHEHSGEHAGPA